MNNTTYPRISTIKANIQREHENFEKSNKMDERKEINDRILKMQEALEKARQYHKAYKV